MKDMVKAIKNGSCIREQVMTALRLPEMGQQQSRAQETVCVKSCCSNCVDKCSCKTCTDNDTNNLVDATSLLQIEK